MLIRLTEKGQKVLGFKPDRKVVQVADDRAYVMMDTGLAVVDKGFMLAHGGPVSELEHDTPEPKPEPKPKPKKEKAVSRKAKKREKATED